MERHVHVQRHFVFDEVFGTHPGVFRYDGWVERSDVITFTVLSVFPFSLSLMRVWLFFL